MVSKIHPRVLLVEGDGDIWVVLRLLEKNGIIWERNEDPVIQIEYPGYPNKEKGGINELLKPKFIASYLRASGRSALGLMVDADEDASLCWQRIKDVCRQSVTNIPDKLPETGLICDTQNSVGDPVKFGVWIMPNNQRRGMVETFLADLISDDHEPLWKYAQEVAAEAKTRGAPFIEAHRDKAKIYSWLAWQDPPGLELHQAVSKQMINPQHPKAQVFIGWIRALYSL